MDGALYGISLSHLELDSEMYTLVTVDSETKVIFKLHKFFLDRDPLQMDTLLQPYQIRSFDIIINNSVKYHCATNGEAEGQ